MYARAGSAIPWPLHGYSIFSSTPARALPRLRCPFQAEIPEKRGKSPPARTTAQRMQSLACCRVHGRCVHATARQMRGHHGAALGHQAWRRIVWAETAAGTLRKPPPRASLSTQRTAAFWMGSFSAIGSARTASDRSSSNLAFWTTTRTGHPTQWRTELVLPVPCYLAIQISSTCEVGKAKHTKSHVRAFSVTSDIGKISCTALRATTKVNLR
jgi:hypothetical protein